MKKLMTGLCLLSILGSGTAQAKVKLPEILSDNMVLQQQTEVNLWGTATPNTEVHISPSWSRETVTVQADSKGNWTARLATPSASYTPQQIDFSDGEHTRLNNILIGEVWFCSGQSNMEMPLNGFWNCPIENANETIATAGEWKGIRVATIAKTGSLTPQEQVKGNWQETNPDTAPWFSATAFSFAQMLNRVLQVP
ncbi:MAG: sialate O-acetylesterase, partial [Bacteroides sp.]|nr:sialate O-acetylesterase [Bacteroides sp.]